MAAAVSLFWDIKYGRRDVNGRNWEVLGTRLRY